MKKVPFVLITLLTLLLSSNGFAADVHWSSRLNGTDINPSQQIIVDGDFTSLLSNQFTDVNQFGYVRLGIEDKTQMDFRGTRRVVLNLEVSPFSNTNVMQAAIPIELTVEYNASSGAITIDGSDYRLPNVYKFKMRVTSATIYNGSGVIVSETLPDYFYLDGGIQAERYYLFDPQDPAPLITTQMVQYNNSGVASAVSTPTVANSSTDEINVTWAYVDGAEYYDLEWTWVDNYSETSLATVVATNALALDANEFRHNSTRIRTSQQSYRIPNTFGRGYLVLRVRAVGRWQTAPTKDLYGDWSSGTGSEQFVSDWDNVITVSSEHEAAKNWQYQATYAEDGKKKEVIQYFDGSLRGRQTVTRINSDDHSVVGETIYDNQGRGTINILPVPQANPAIKYYASLNRNASGNPYSHLDFDWEDTTVTTCVAAAPGILSSTTGAGYYYSAAGHSTDTDWQQYVPESNGFAFTQIEHTPDNTGRVRSQSGVGNAHNIGSGRETAYFYSQASQEALNRLFGYKVGYNARYKKNMVVDANGQVSISYLDAQGRVVATALAGDNTTAFESLYDEINGMHAPVTTDLLNNTALTDTPDDNNDLISTGNFGSLSDGLEYTTQLDVVQDGSLYDFLYTIESGFYEETCNEVTGVKFPYKYDLTLSLKNDCGLQLFDTTYRLIGDEFLSGTISEDLTAAINALNLNQGTYTLSKTLTINEAAMEEYLADYIDPTQNSCLLDSGDFATPQALGCGITCAECITDLGLLASFLQQAALDEGAPLTVDQTVSYTNTYNSLLEACNAPCKIVTPCDAYKGMMLLDLVPGGQYALVSTTDPLSVFNTNNSLAGNWRTSGINYVDANGNPALVLGYPDGNAGYGLSNSGNGPAAMVEPWELNLESFVASFESSWSEALFPYHPEYSLYLFAEEICSEQTPLTTSTGTIDLSSAEFDAILRNQIGTYALSNTNPYGIDFSLSAGIQTIDPYYNLTYGASTPLQTLKQNLLNELITNYKGTGATLLQTAMKLALHPNDYTVVASTISPATWTAVNSLTVQEQDAVWSTYKTLYLSSKDEVNQYFMDLDGFTDNIFNGCIGSGDFSLGVIGSFSQSSYYSAMVQESSNAFFNGAPLPLSLCGTDYNTKIRRMIRVDGLQNTATPVSIQTEAAQATTDYIQWQQTGLCPLTIDVERLLKELAINDLLDQTTAMADLNSFVPDLYEAITGGGVTTSSDMDVIGSISSGTLNVDFYNVPTTTTECTIAIPQIDASYPWSTYGTNWHIYNVYNSFPTGTANNTKIIVLAGTSPTTAEEIIVTYTTGCATLNGCQTAYAANNQSDPNCNREEEFEAAMTIVLRTLVENGNYNNSSYNLSGLGAFTSSVLPSYFPGTVTWNGVTGTFSFTGGSYQIGFTPTTSTLYFNAYDLFEGVAYANVFTGTIGAVTSVSPSGSITFTSTTSILDFNCPCETMLDDQALISQENAAETAYLNILNYVWANTVTNGTMTADVDLLAPYTQCHISQSAIYGASKTSTSIAFGIADISAPPSSGMGACGSGFSWSGYTIAYFQSVDVTLNGANSVSVIAVDVNGIEHTLTTSLGETNYSALCPSCPSPLTQVEPVSCTNAFEYYSNDMNTIFSGDINLGNTQVNEQAIFNTEYIGSQEEFCGYSYAYISTAYLYYLNEMNITTVNDPLFLTISEFGTTGLGYSSADLITAVDAYRSTLSTSPYYANPLAAGYLPWNDYIATIYLETLSSYCPPLMPAPYFIEPEMPEFDCNEWINNVYAANQANQYGIYIDQIAESFKQAYIAGAMATVKETFTESHDDKEYHYTLYYYDRSGNLISTVPPQGVDRLEAGEPSTYTNAQINAYRASTPGATANTSSGTKMAPEHTFRTVYRYNSLNQLVYQSTPDGGESRFAYDALGRLVVSQNAKQAAETTPQFSYTSYDGLGRVSQVGEMTLAGHEINAIGKLVLTGTSILANVNASNFPTNLAPAAREEVTRTIYDELLVSGTPMTVNVTDNFGTGTTTDVNAQGLFEDYADDNTRNRITAVVYQQNYDVDITNYESALFYDYDVHGNVKEMFQVYDHAKTKRHNQHVKHINYAYDLVSGNMDKVTYQKGQQDQFMHRYAYDSDNRITIAETSKDGVVYEKDAKYFYYDHGPLARSEVGEDKVQTNDYAYTIQGWIKTVNGEEVDETTMMGEDGRIGTINENGARDVFGFSLNYFEGDYDAYETSMLNISDNLTSMQQTAQHGASLYNGNIRAMYTTLSNFNEVALGTHQSKYSYDQLNRIKSMTGYNATVGTPNPSFAASGYSSNYSFDKNGNLETLQRYAWNGSTSLLMDDFVYHYDETTPTGGVNNNQLSWVEDDATNNVGLHLSEFANADIDGSMDIGNYDYDAIGQLVSDTDEGITNIDWKVTNKVELITFASGKTIAYDYDPMGNRIAEHVTTSGVTKSTFYILDAQGNQMAIYESTYSSQPSPTIYLEERNMYGSSRVGSEYLTNVSMAYVEIANPPAPPAPSNHYVAHQVGDKRYEFSNHLGNVLQVLTDRKLATDLGNDNDVDYFTADVVSYNDYYPYGMTMPNRNGSVSEYRYGFQGQESDDEVKGEGNSVNYKYRMHDPRIGRFFAVDPLAAKYPHYSPYSFSGNKVIHKVELEGLEEGNITLSSGNTSLTLNGEFTNEQIAEYQIMVENVEQIRQETQKIMIEVLTGFTLVAPEPISTSTDISDVPIIISLGASNAYAQVQDGIVTVNSELFLKMTEGFQISVVAHEMWAHYFENEQDLIPEGEAVSYTLEVENPFHDPNLPDKGMNKKYQKELYLMGNIDTVLEEINGWTLQKYLAENGYIEVSTDEMERINETLNAYKRKFERMEQILLEQQEVQDNSEED